MSDLILKSINRQPFQWIEIDMPKCLLDYGNGLCSAVQGVTGAEKCHNTRATCQVPGDYDATDNVLTYSFCDNRGYIPDDRYYFPYLDSVSVSPASLNLGGGNKNKSALGTMATLSATFSDHPHTDRIVDPYLSSRDYDPYERSTFWAKWRARNPYYMHRELRYYSGYIDPTTGYVDPATLVTRTFFVTGFGGFSAGGNVSVKAADIMTFIANDKAKAPKVSTGKLSGSLNTGAGSLTLTPSGIGDLEYPASGKIRINKEVMSFTRTGDDMNITRGIVNTEAASHADGDSVQLCLEFSSKKPDEILFDLETIYAGIPASYLDTAQWAAEVTDHMPRLYSALITEPTGVRQLISEMSEQMYFAPVWDERNARQYIKAVRPVSEEVVTNLTDDRNLLEDSVTWNDEADQLITDVWVYYGQKNPVLKLDEGTNYAALDVVSDTDSKSVDRNNTEKVKVVYSRWINEGGAAIDLGDKTLARYNEIPRSCSFSLDAKDRDLWLADFVTMRNRHVVDSNGLSLPVAMQITSAQESQQGTTYSYIAQQYSGKLVDEGGGGGGLGFVISSDYVNLNLREYYNKFSGGTPTSGDVIEFTIRSGVTIGGCAFTDVENVSDSASTATDVSTTINDLASKAIFQGSFRRYTNYSGSHQTRSISLAKVQRKGIITDNLFNIGNTYTNPRVGAYNQALACSVHEYPVKPSLVTGAWPAGVEIIINIEPLARVIGEAPISPIGYSTTFSSSNGGFSYTGGKALAFGGDGGDAIEITDANPTVKINNQGTISGAGGAGAGVSDAWGSQFNQTYGGAAISGGGGQGYDYGQPIVAVGDLTNQNKNNITVTPSAGSLDAAGNLGRFSTLRFFYSGAGGEVGQDGGYSKFDAFGSVTVETARNGLAGAAISKGANLINWINKGTVIGAEID